jgi:protein MpaA
VRLNHVFFRYILALASTACLATDVFASESMFPISKYNFSDAFIQIPIVLKSHFNSYMVQEGESQTSIARLCKSLATNYKPLKWDPVGDGCGQGIPWKSKFKSHDQHPLIWAEYGSGSNTTLILGGVHPDELTPIPIAFRMASHLHKNPHLVTEHSRVIVAPLVNPDGFIRKTASRTNRQGVDLNRNFFTRDWYSSAKSWWAHKRDRSPRHFPGYIPNSEIETLFQIWLIDTFKPDKIISIHAPLGFYDYDGPGERRNFGLTESETKAKELVHSMSASSRNYKIVDYSFYPGSLGNYAGNERGIPTITLELETTNPAKVNDYWTQFVPGLEQAIRHPFTNQKNLDTPQNRLSQFLHQYASQM